MTSLAVAGCVIPVTVGDVEDDDQGSGGGTSSSITMGTTAPDGTTSSPAPAGSTSTGEPGDGTANGETAEDDGTTEGEPASICDPQPTDISAWMHVLEDGEEWLEGITTTWDEPCEVVAVSDFDLGYTIGLQCDSLSRFVPADIELIVEQPLDLPVQVGQQVRYRGVFDVGPDTPFERYIAVSDPAGTLLLGMMWRHKDDFLAEGNALFAPLGLEVATDVCDPEPYMSPEMEGRSFIFEPCGEQIERHAVDVSVGEAEPQRIFDQHRQTVGGYDVWVLQADTADPQERECVLTNIRTRVRMVMVAIP